MDDEGYEAETETENAEDGASDDVAADEDDNHTETTETTESEDWVGLEKEEETKSETTDAETEVEETETVGSEMNLSFYEGQWVPSGSI